MKKIIVIALTLVAGIVAPVHADVPPAIVVIDNGTNTALFGDKIAYEVCMVSMTACPNGQKTMEGTGAANLPATKNKDFNHGTQMISLVLRFNPNVKVIPIRIVGMTPAGNPGLYNLDDVNKAFDWVVANRVKFNIAAVSLSQGAVLANCKVPAGMSDKIAALKSFNVPVIAAVGNNSNRTAVFSPSCLPDTVSVGATDNPWPGIQPYEYDPKAAPYIARYSNGATGQVDFYVNGRWNATMLDGTTKFTVGTSNSTAVMAAWWVLNRKASFDETFNYLMSTTIDANNEWVTGKYIPIA
jgi:hypothetical protein